MRQVVAALTVIGCLAHQAPALGSDGPAAAGKQRIDACSFLTRELVLQVSPYEQQPAAERDMQRQLLSALPPREEPVGPSGSSCGYGNIQLQVDPFTSPAKVEKGFADTLQPIPGVGDVAYFRDNKGHFAELYVREGKRVLTIQMSIPRGRTAESVKPNTVALAKALLPKLK